MTYEQLFKYFGSVRRISKATEAFPQVPEGATVQSIYLWKGSGVPELWQRRFEELTGGKLQCDPALKVPPAAFKRLAEAGLLRPFFRIADAKPAARGG